MIARARELQAENFADEIVDISDDSTNDWVDRETQAGRIIRVLDHEHVQRSRLRVDARFKLMEKFAPDRYGQRQQITGANGRPLFERLQNMTEEQRLAEATALMEQARCRLAMAALADGTRSEADYTEVPGGGIGDTVAAPMGDDDRKS